MHSTPKIARHLIAQFHHLHRPVNHRTQVLLTLSFYIMFVAEMHDPDAGTNLIVNYIGCSDHLPETNFLLITHLAGLFT